MRDQEKAAPARGYQNDWICLFVRKQEFSSKLIDLFSATVWTSHGGTSASGAATHDPKRPQPPTHTLKCLYQKPLQRMSLKLSQLSRCWLSGPKSRKKWRDGRKNSRRLNGSTNNWWASMSAYPSPFLYRLINQRAGSNRCLKKLQFYLPQDHRSNHQSPSGTHTISRTLSPVKTFCREKSNCQFMCACLASAFLFTARH